jgi:hypothetical protein
MIQSGNGLSRKPVWSIRRSLRSLGERYKVAGAFEMATLKYIERCTGTNHIGPAWIGYVEQSKSGLTLYFNGLGLSRAKNHTGVGNYVDVEARELYWVSGIKQRGSNRHWAGSGLIEIERAAIPEFLRLTGAATLDKIQFVVRDSFAKTDREKLHEVENEHLL